jgi:hypothetical protein
VDPRALQKVEVEDVGRLAELEEHEVGRINDVVARDLADRDQPPLQPFRAWSDPNALDDARGVAGAECVFMVRDANMLRCASATRLRRSGGQLQRASGRCGNLAGHADVAQAVTSVRGRLDLLPQLPVRGRVTAVELQRRGAARIEENATRLGMRKRVEVKVIEPNELGDADRADAVLLDAPCTGLGTTRRKPEIARRHTDADVTASATLQEQLFDKAASLTKEGGTLVYSVCSPLPEEGALQVARFLTRHPDFEREHLSVTLPFMPPSAFDEHGQLRLIPPLHDADAFFVARLRRLGARLRRLGASAQAPSTTDPG